MVPIEAVDLGRVDEIQIRHDGKGFGSLRLLLRSRSPPKRAIE